MEAGTCSQAEPLPLEATQPGLVEHYMSNAKSQPIYRLNDNVKLLKLTYNVRLWPA